MSACTLVPSDYSRVSFSLARRQRSHVVLLVAPGVRSVKRCCRICWTGTAKSRLPAPSTSRSCTCLVIGRQRPLQVPRDATAQHNTM